MRYSKQREVILELVRSTHSHPTADWVYTQVRKKMPNVSLGTVYRNLGQLVDANVINVLKYDGVVHYDGNVAEHQHFSCQVCGNIFDIDVDVSDLMNQVETKTRYHVADYQLHIIGICNTCHRNKN